MLPVGGDHRGYIAFLFPGLLGLTLASVLLWGLTSVLVQMRSAKLLKHIMATPLSRANLLLGVGLAHLLLGMFAVLLSVGMGRLLFGLRIHGSFFAVLLFGALGCMAFCSLAILLASRARNIESAKGGCDLLAIMMTIFGGVFFPSTNFPEWAQPILRLIPMRALLDAFRGIINEGRPAASLAFELLVLVGWGVIPAALGIRLFRWN